ncbi:hypothetical protein AAZV13_06G203950 [Glycine max]
MRCVFFFNLSPNIHHLSYHSLNRLFALCCFVAICATLKANQMQPLLFHKIHIMIKFHWQKEKLHPFCYLLHLFCILNKSWLPSLHNDIVVCNHLGSIKHGIFIALLRCKLN